jgi:transposase
MERIRSAGSRLLLQSRSKSRASSRPLRRFKGTLQVDGYAGFEQLVPTGIVLAACWAHTRRKFYEVHQATGSPIASEALRRIGELYAIEGRIRGRSDELRRTIRRELAQPLVDTLKTWLAAELDRVPPRSPLADAIRYALVRWKALCLYLDDGRVELDTNTVERAIRPIALGRKNHLFAGSDGGADRWAIVCSLITTAKLNDREPYAYLKDVLDRVTNGHPASRLDDLLPWNWEP